MTKDEACELFKRLSTEPVTSWAEYKRRCREILDQIDPPQEFSVRRVCELIGKSTNVGYVTIHGDGTSTIATLQGPNVACAHIADLERYLIELAKPPKPKTVMVEMPLSTVEYIANTDSMQCASVKMLGDRCRDALAKLIELSTPPKPTTVAVELSIDWVKGYLLTYPACVVGQSMRDALAKLEQQQQS